MGGASTPATPISSESDGAFVEDLLDKVLLDDEKAMLPLSSGM